MPNRECSFEDVAAAIEAGRRFVLTSHVNPDGDGVGCCLALAELLDALGKEVIVYNEHRLPAAYEYLPTGQRFTQRLPDAYDTAVFLECPDNTRIGQRVDDVMRTADRILNIDHHATNALYGTHNYIDVTAAALGEMIHPFFPHFGVELNYPAAIALWTSLMTDTGSFKYSNTRPHTLRLAADLMEHGIQPAPIYESIYERRSAGGTRLFGRALAEVQTELDGKLAYTVIPYAWFEETGALPEDLENLPETLRGITGVEVSVVMREDRRGAFKISLRSKRDADVCSVARAFGGGGHKKAAGATIPGTVAEVQAQLLPLVRAVLQNGN